MPNCYNPALFKGPEWSTTPAVAPSMRIAVYDACGELRGVFGQADDAVPLVVKLGDGTQIRDHFGWSAAPLWIEGAELRPADGNAAFVAGTVYSRLA